MGPIGPLWGGFGFQQAPRGPLGLLDASTAVPTSFNKHLFGALLHICRIVTPLEHCCILGNCGTLEHCGMCGGIVANWGIVTYVGALWHVGALFHIWSIVSYLEHCGI